MISKRKYKSLLSKLPKHHLHPGFEKSVMENLKLEAVKKKSSRHLYALCCTALSIFILIMISSSPPATKQAYTNVGENAIIVSNQLFYSVISGSMPQR